MHRAHLTRLSCASGLLKSDSQSGKAAPMRSSLRQHKHRQVTQDPSLCFGICCAMHASPQVTCHAEEGKPAHRDEGYQAVLAEAAGLA